MDSEKPIIDGRRPDDPGEQDELIYEKHLDEYVKMKFRSPDKMDDIAQSFAVFISILITIYSAAIKFSEIRSMDWWLRIITILPILLWISAVACALTALRPAAYRVFEGDLSSIKRYLEKLAERKYRWLKKCGWLIISGLVILMAVLVIYVFDA